MHRFWGLTHGHIWGPPYTIAELSKVLVNLSKTLTLRAVCKKLEGTQCSKSPPDVEGGQWFQTGAQGRATL